VGKQKRSVHVAECDGCQNKHYYETAEDEPNGYYGSVRVVLTAGASATQKKFYACSPTCVAPAIAHVTSMGD
jgi:hypothetical protein